jgi:uncharacterized protein (UPF0264 family)
MTGMLASVKNLEETRLILNTSVDIIDLKQPEQGALGALPIEIVKIIVNEVNHKRPISATVGDLPMQAELVFNAVKTMAETSVDYIKIGFFPGGDWQGTLSKLAKISQQHKLIAVLFADTNLDVNTIKSLKKAGFYGVMLDTMDKTNGSLSQVMAQSEINHFVSNAKSAQMLCGLAGSLKQQDISELIELDVDYLGFRGALCKKHNRIAELDMDSIQSISSCF